MKNVHNRELKKISAKNKDLNDNWKRKIIRLEIDLDSLAKSNELRDKTARVPRVEPSQEHLEEFKGMVVSFLEDGMETLSKEMSTALSKVLETLFSLRESISQEIGTLSKENASMYRELD